MKKLWLIFALIMFNQVGSIGFGVDRYRNRMLMEPKKDDESGGGGGGDDKKDPPADDEKDKKPGADDNKDKKEFDISSLPQEAQDLIKNLRKENGKHRTDKNLTAAELEKFKKAFKIISGEDDEEEPEVKLSKVSEELSSAKMKTAMLELAYENNIPTDQRDYFEFLMSKKLESLEEGEELSEEGLAEIVAKVTKKGPANTSTKEDGKGDGKKAPAGQADGVTLDQFLAMGMLAKSKLYSEKPEIYNALLAEAKQKKLL